VRLTQTNDISLLLNSVASCEIRKRPLTNFLSVDGQADFFNAIKVAQLSLKHRQNKS